MQVWQLIVIVLIGLSLGVVGGLARVPTVKWLPFLSSVVLVGMGYTAFLVVWELSLVDALLFVLAVSAGNVLYGARLWQQLALEPGLSYWTWVQRDFLHTAYLRRLYRSSSPIR
ncbi:hypothetical protein OL239_03985 [Arthrobacter sp. ATA002]|uniref:hypothetical protein n=1 Tax=Arthrobacter sp. ATA002 TaxID=2991715 RepID=UPI0022A7901B|nr:hypothetical protein [Arthrobacter sp. ATA002]WAP52436.1 hypothetical protein OL239_03985 [Arthrobacter sp. ATA002]